MNVHGLACLNSDAARREVATNDTHNNKPEGYFIVTNHNEQKAAFFILKILHENSRRRLVFFQVGE